jgi:hypothetical protein
VADFALFHFYIVYIGLSRWGHDAIARMGDARRAAMQSRIAAIYCSAENLFALERSFRLNSVEKVCPIAAGRDLKVP